MTLRKTKRTGKRPPPRNAKRKVRLRLDVYDKSKQQYRPFAGKSIIILLETTRLHAPLWRAITKMVDTKAWEEEIQPEERARDDD
jgi:hypothetical protein